MKNFALLALILTLTACGTTTQISQNDLSRPIRKGEARIIVTRDTSLLYLGAAAEIKANGAKIASLAPGGSAVRDLKAGPVVLEVTTFGSFGRYVLRINTAPGKTYNAVVSPRDGNMPLVSAFGMIGDAVNASGNDQSGYFQIGLKDGEQ